MDRYERQLGFPFYWLQTFLIATPSLHGILIIGMFGRSFMIILKGDTS
jgi:hypothetical protein